MICEAKLYITNINGLEVSGTLYGVTITFTTPQPEAFSVNKENNVLTYFDLKLDQNKIAMYGFKDKMVKEVFLLLLTVPGIGPKVACQILSLNDIEELIININSKNIIAISKMNKISEKMATKIISELAHKVAKIKEFVSSPTVFNTELEQSLLSLGFRKDQIAKLKNIPQDTPLPERIKLAIKQINE